LLNARGHAALLDRTLDARNPPLEYLAEEGEPPHGVYIWSMVVPGLSAIATPMVTKALGRTCAGRPLYAGAGTQGGLNLMRRQGFNPVTPKDDAIGGLFLFGKLGDLKVRPLKSHPMVSRFKTIVVSTPDEMEKVRAIRTVFMLEQNCPYDEEFDGNDFSGTHILGYVDGEPAATMRLRYFADFVKLERLAVLPRFRRTLIAKEVVNTAVNLCRRKGYTKVYGHAQKRLVNFWARFGFKPIDKNYALVFSDHEYVELWGELEPHSNPITMYSDPYLFLRPEGRWDEPGILEKSAQRPPTNPH
jgi:predicted GNAT family N-acyltransferase